MSGGAGWLAAAEGGTSLINTAIQGYQQRKNLERQNKYNRQMADYTYNKDLEMWNKANEYNSPQAQMQRLKDAGLNPNLVYGHGTVAGQSAGTVPKYQTPSADFNVNPMIGLPESTLAKYMDLAMKQAQIDNVRSQNRGIEADNIVKEVNAKVATSYGEQSGYENLYAKIYRNKVLNAQGLLTESQADMAETKRKQYQVELSQQREGERLRNESQQLENIYKTFRNDFMRMGITSSDNIVFRMIARMIMNTGIWKGWGTGSPNLEMIK